MLCPNCGERFHPPNLRGMYCSLRCKDEAKYVRYHRRVLVEYPDGPPEDVAIAVRMKRVYALGNGYDATARRLSPETRAAVIERDRGMCVMCGQPGEEIDHIDGPSSDLMNLRFLCKECHRFVTEEHIKPIVDEDTKDRTKALYIRVHVAEDPVFPSDRDDWDDIRKAWKAEHTLFERTLGE